MSSPVHQAGIAYDPSRVRNRYFQGLVTDAASAVAAIGDGDTVAISGFASAGTPKAFAPALAERIRAVRSEGGRMSVNLLTGASVANEAERTLAEVDGIALRMPYQSEPTARRKINAGEMDYVDVHLSHVAQQVWQGYYGNVDVAVVEVAAITEDGKLVPGMSVGNNKTWLDVADKVILEVNSWVPLGVEGMHDIYYGTALPPDRTPIMLTSADSRIGQVHLEVDPAKVIAVIPTNHWDSKTILTPPDAVSEAIAGHVLEFFHHEVSVGRLPEGSLLPLQAGIGNVANAVLSGLAAGPYSDLTCYSEVIQDSMLRLIKDGKVSHASATALALSGDGLSELVENFDRYRRHITLRPQEISNHPEVVRRLGIIAMNGMLEADIYGNVNSTHVGGTKIMNGVGGSGDFTRNGNVSMFLSPSTAKNGAVSAIVPMVPHVDHTEHDVQVIVTEHGLADLRSLSPRKRSRLIVDRCADPSFRPLLHDYLDRAEARPDSGNTPHILEEAFSFHTRFAGTGSMLR
ncbi:succinate CoA transferase [Rhodococcus sp. IEGM 1408]|uniref:succinate CoA transferase n=1 Tax=Rhodococcus sp. IEGM 1408 TaxID=3082220 RepID=UPI0029553486|nr:succinate CoA transferase [Rhodococcus sp. IEGM 1408]MDV8001252.1 succinate CoA transferase [Rhodococcus sp. IEGM 1408]